MFRTKLIASLFTFALVGSLTGCLTETDSEEPDQKELSTNDPDADGEDQDNGCRLDRKTGELECPEE